MAGEIQLRFEFQGNAPTYKPPRNGAFKLQMRRDVTKQDFLISSPLHHMSFILSHLLPPVPDKLNDDSGMKTFHGPEDLMIFSGSMCEDTDIGYLIKGGSDSPDDIDIMMPLNQVITDRLYLNTDNVHSGYARLARHSGTNTVHPELGEVFVGKEGVYYLSGKCLRDYIYEQMLPCLPHPMKTSQKYHISGPAFTLSEPFVDYKGTTRDSNSDFVCCMHFKNWPKFADEWRRRPRMSGWPSSGLIQSIINKGFHVVPVAHHCSKDPDLEWRISFTTAERDLMLSLTRFQRECYIWLKILIKEGFRNFEWISSYHIKTTYMWLLEEIPGSYFHRGNLADIIIMILDRLIHCYSKQNLPHYFIPTNNLIQHLKRDNLKNILKLLSMIRRNPLRYILDFVMRLDVVGRDDTRGFLIFDNTFKLVLDDMILLPPNPIRSMLKVFLPLCQQMFQTYLQRVYDSKSNECYYWYDRPLELLCESETMKHQLLGIDWDFEIDLFSRICFESSIVPRTLEFTLASVLGALGSVLHFLSIHLLPQHATFPGGLLHQRFLRGEASALFKLAKSLCDITDPANKYTYRSILAEWAAFLQDCDNVEEASMLLSTLNEIGIKDSGSIYNHYAGKLGHLVTYTTLFYYWLHARCPAITSSDLESIPLKMQKFLSRAEKWYSKQSSEVDERGDKSEMGHNQPNCITLREHADRYPPATVLANGATLLDDVKKIQSKKPK